MWKVRNLNVKSPALDNYVPLDSTGSEYNFGAPSKTRVLAFLFGLLTLDWRTWLQIKIWSLNKISRLGIRPSSDIVFRDSYFWIRLYSIPKTTRVNLAVTVNRMVGSIVTCCGGKTWSVGRSSSLPLCAFDHLFHISYTLI